VSQIGNLSAARILAGKKVVLNKNLGDHLDGDSWEDVVRDGDGNPADVVAAVNRVPEDVFPTLGVQLGGDAMDKAMDGNVGDGAEDVGGRRGDDPKDVDRDGDGDCERVIRKDGGDDPEDLVRKGGDDGPEDVGGNGDNHPQDMDGNGNNPIAVVPEGSPKDQHAMEQDVDGNVDGDDWTPRSRTSSLSSLSTTSAHDDQPTAGVDSEEELSDAMEVDGGSSAIGADLEKSPECLEHLSEPADILAIEGATPMVGVESNQAHVDNNGPGAGSSPAALSLQLMKAAAPQIGLCVNPETANCRDDLDSLDSLGLAAPLVLRRSSRNAHSKNQSTPQVLLPKLSSRRRKPAPKKHEVLFFEVSVPQTQPEKLLTSVQDDAEDERPKLC
jgi:hypothetical protein